MIRKRVSAVLAIPAAVACLTGLGVTVAPVASAAQQEIPLPNGLTVLLQDPGPDGSRSVRTLGRPRVGDYVTQKINVRFPNGQQFERPIDEKNSLSDTFILSRNQTDVSVQACRSFTFDDTICTQFSPFKNDVPKAAPPPPPAKVNCPPGSVSPQVDQGQACVAAPKPNVICPADSPVKEVPAGQTCPAPKPPTNAVQMNITRAGLQAKVKVTSTADIPGQCTYNAEEINGLGLPANRDFSLGPKGNTELTFPAPLIGQTYRVVVACRGDFKGQNIEFGRVQQDFS